MGDAPELVTGRLQGGANGEDPPGIDARRRQEHLADGLEGDRRLLLDRGIAAGVTEGARELFLVGPLQRDLPLGEEAPDEGEAVRMQA